MRVERSGQTSGQRVKTKSAIQTRPARSSLVTVEPCRSVSENGGSVPKIGGASGCPQASATRTGTLSASARAIRAGGRASVRGLAPVLDGRGDEACDRTEI